MLSAGCLLGSGCTGLVLWLSALCCTELGPSGEMSAQLRLLNISFLLRVPLGISLTQSGTFTGSSFLQPLRSWFGPSSRQPQGSLFLSPGIGILV